MSATTSIEWTERTWNPVTGCDKVSPGCAHCYAEGVAERFWATQYPKVPDEGYGMPGAVKQLRTREFTDVQTHEDRLLEPLKWRTPARVFVNSMSDLFHEDVPDAFIDKVFAVMALAPKHTFQILTKRPERMRDYVTARVTNVADALRDMGREANAITLVTGLKLNDSEPKRRWPLRNVWLGVSVENQHFADDRIPLLLQTPAAVRFISAEPLLGSIDLHSPVLEADSDDYLDWVIVGGESGSKARPMDLAWARSIVEQCQAAGTPVFVKQLGTKPTCDGCGDTVAVFGVRDRKGGDPGEWPTDLRVREYPAL